MLDRLLQFLCYSILVLSNCACVNRANPLNLNTDKLVDAKVLDPTEIAAYDKEECEPFQGMSLMGYEIDAVNKSNDTLSTKEIWNDTVLFARYSQYACGDCITFLNSALVNFSSKNPSSKIILLLKDINIRDIHVLENKLGKRLEILKIDSLPTDIDEGYTPYLFRIGKNQCIKDLYIPRKELPDSLHKYLNNQLTFKTINHPTL